MHHTHSFKEESIGWDGIVSCALPRPKSPYTMILELVHVSVDINNNSRSSIARRVLFEGYWWHTLFKDAIDFVYLCQFSGWREPHRFSTLFSVKINSNLSHYIEKYLTP